MAVTNVAQGAGMAVSGLLADSAGFQDHLCYSRSFEFIDLAAIINHFWQGFSVKLGLILWLLSKVDFAI